jgi:hypothetical protein
MKTLLIKTKLSVKIQECKMRIRMSMFLGYGRQKRAKLVERLFRESVVAVQSWE